jgi:Asp-tRNA(Asn)/Glu-tRNA(Gln) amidotransferase A subunit family amidase
MLSILDIRRRIDAGRISPLAALQQSREAILAGNAELEAFACVAEIPAAAIDAAAPLAGIATGVKDVIDTAALPTELGWKPIYGGWQPRSDAVVVTLLEEAGATLMGKTVTTPFAVLDPAPTLNPHDPTRTPGGSSSGSAAAVAAGLVPLAIGTQTAASVVRPAAYCGVAGIKPSFRLLPTAGVKTTAWTLDTLGLFAATVPDLAYALAAISGREMGDPAADHGAPRIGVVRQTYAGEPQPEGVEALDRAARLAAAAGAFVREFDLPPSFAEGWEAQWTIYRYELRRSLGWEWRHRRAEMPPLLAGMLAQGDAIPTAEYDRLRGVARRARAAARSVFEENGVDVLLTYSAAGEAPDRSSTGDPRFARLFTLLGVPAINVPGLHAPSGLPVGVQVVAPFARDARALAAAAFLERVIAAA